VLRFVSIAQDSTIPRRPKQDTDDGIQFFHVVEEDLDFLAIVDIRQVKYRETCLWKWDAGRALDNETKKISDCIIYFEIHK
jgi:hypothetical protein